MKYTKQMLTATVLSAAVLGGGAFALSASAQSNASDPGDSLAAKIATKFNLNKDEVKKVIDEERSAHQAERKAERQNRIEERLAQAVKDGKITDEQKTKILDFVKSQESFFESLRDMSEDERKTALDNHRAEVKKWASDNGIDEKYIMLGGGPGMRGGHDGLMKGMHDKNGGETDDTIDQQTN